MLQFRLSNLVTLHVWDLVFVFSLIILFCNKDSAALGRRTHLIYWNTSNPMFRENALREIYMTMTDRLIFICPDRILPTNKVFWTLNEATYSSCQPPEGELREPHLLVDCFTKPPAYQYFLNITDLIEQLHYSEIQHFTHIYFLADFILCKNKNMHINMTVIIPTEKVSEIKGTNMAMADSAAESDDLSQTSSSKPFLTENGLTLKPKNKRLIGLLIAYILITLLVVYMVVCAVCFQPQKCKPCFHRSQIEERPKERRNSRSRFNRSTACTNSTNLNINEIQSLPRVNRHFSRSVDGERFVHREASLELLHSTRSQHSLSNSAIPNSCNHNYTTTTGSINSRMLMNNLDGPFFVEPQGYTYIEGEAPIFVSFDNPPPLYVREGDKEQPVTFTRIAC